MVDDDDDPKIRLTKVLHQDGGWPIAVAALERVNTWAVLAVRLGALALLQECTRAMAQPSAPKRLVVRAREIVDALD